MIGMVANAIEDGIVTSLVELDRALEALRASYNAPSHRQAQQTQFALERMRDCESAIALANTAAQGLVAMLGLQPVQGEDVVRKAASEAISRHRVLWITYTDANNIHTEREVEPIMLEPQLMLAYCRMRHGYRRFYLGRVGSAAMTTKKFTRHCATARNKNSS